MDRTLPLDSQRKRRGLERLVGLGTLWAALVVLTCAPALAQTDADAEPFTDDELETIVGRIALYPDDLIGIILPASTYPLQIVQATRFLDEHEEDSSLEPDPAWDESVVALLNYPEVLRRLDEDLDWTWELGAAVLEDEGRVLDAIQEFRDRAYAAGNLQSDDRQVVTEEEGAIEIRPADPEVIYVPVYEPRRVVVHSPAPVIRYHPWRYPVYYYPYPSGFTFGLSYRTGFFWGVTSAFSIGWHTHHVHVYHHEHTHHPYYRRRHVYTAPHFARRSVSVHIDVSRSRPVWRPGRRIGARPDRAISVSRGSRVNEVRTTATGRRVAGTERYTGGAARARSSAARSGERERARGARAAERSGSALRPTRPARPASAAETARARQSARDTGAQRERARDASPRANQERARARTRSSAELRPSRAARPPGDATDARGSIRRARGATRAPDDTSSSPAPRTRAPVELGRGARRAPQQSRARSAPESAGAARSSSRERTATRDRSSSRAASQARQRSGTVSRSRSSSGSRSSQVSRGSRSSSSQAAGSSRSSRASGNSRAQRSSTSRRQR